jgi:hypothetical protein
LADCGGTDVCTAFIGTNPLLPVYVGELQACTASKLVAPPDQRVAG